MAEFTEDILETLREKVEDWGERTEEKLQMSLVSVGAVYSGAGQKSIDSGAKMMQDRSIYIGFRLKRYLVMIEKGAGKGHGGKKGSVWKGLDGKMKRTNPASLGKMNSGGRPAKPFFNVVIKAEIKDLADEVGEFFYVKARQAIIK